MEPNWTFWILFFFLMMIVVVLGKSYGLLERIVEILERQYPDPDEDDDL